MRRRVPSNTPQREAFRSRHRRARRDRRRRVRDASRGRCAVRCLRARPAVVGSRERRAAARRVRPGRHQHRRHARDPDRGRGPRGRRPPPAASGRARARGRDTAARRHIAHRRGPGLVRGGRGGRSRADPRPACSGRHAPDRLPALRHRSRGRGPRAGPRPASPVTITAPLRGRDGSRRTAAATPSPRTVPVARRSAEIVSSRRRRSRWTGSSSAATSRSPATGRAPSSGSATAQASSPRRTARSWPCATASRSSRPTRCLRAWIRPEPRATT